MKPRKIPMRMCVGCREMKPKKDLIRIVRAPENGGISVDFKGKKPGRGAYICADAACLTKSKKIRALERTFECDIPDEVYTQMHEQIRAGDNDE